jgi:hypothetical protein
MTFTWRVYLALSLVAIVSFLGAWLLPTTDIMHGIMGAPAIMALIGIIYQIFRDQAEYEKRLLLQRDQQHFVLGATSPMASVAFNKHVEFCEKYITQMQKILSDLFREGPTRECLQWSSELADVRLAYRTWLTSDLQAKIMPFEEALTKVGGKHLESAALPGGESRNRTIEEMHDVFADLLGIPRLRGTTDETVAPTRIMDHLQDILGVKQLVRLRIELVDEAVRALEAKG